MKEILDFKEYPNYIKKYIFIAYSFSFLLWILSYVLIGDKKLLLGHEILDWSTNTFILIPSIIALIAGFGPLLGYLFIRKQAQNLKNITLIGFTNTLKIFSLFSISTLLISVFLGGELNLSTNQIPYLFIALIFFVTISGSEEFGWRGIFYPYICTKAKTFHQANLVTALIWGFWHTPILMIIFKYQNLEFFQFIPMFILFLASMYLMSYFHGWVNLRTNSILPNILLHGLLGWWTFFLTFILTDSIIQIAVLIGYILTMILFDKYFPSDKLLNKMSR